MPKTEVKDSYKKSITKMILGLIPGLSKSQTTAIVEAIDQIVKHVNHRHDPWGTSEINEYVKEIIKDKLIVSPQLLLVDKAKEVIDKHVESGELDKGFNRAREIINYIGSPTFQSYITSIQNQDFLKSDHRKTKHSGQYDDAKSWWYLFMEILDRYMDEWRYELLGRALARGTKERLDNGMVSNGVSISYKTLWEIAHLSAHIWDDLVSYQSIAAKIYVNGEFNRHAILGYFSISSQCKYEIADGETRLVRELLSSLNEDGLIREGDVELFDIQDEVFIVVDNQWYEVRMDENYRDPEFSDEYISKNMKNKYKVYGSWPTYVAEEILGLSYDVETNPLTNDVLMASIEDLRQEGILLIKSSPPPSK